MGNRSNFERVDRDFYPTPKAAVLPLLPHLIKHQYFWEPCAGDGALVDHLLNAEMDICAASDIEPMGKGIDKHDALTDCPYHGFDYIITNPHGIVRSCTR